MSASSSRPGASSRRRRSPPSASSSRCCTGSVATCRSGSAARGTACGSTSPSAPSGILTSCVAWPSGRRTSPSSWGTSYANRCRDAERADAGRLHGQARARRRFRRQRRPGLFGGDLRGGRARPPGTLRGFAPVRALGSRGRPADRPRRDRRPRLGPDPGGGDRAGGRALALRRQGGAGRGDRPGSPGVVTAPLGTVLERDGSVYRVATPAGEIRAVLSGKAKRDTSKVVVGDVVRLEPEPGGALHAIVGIEPRSTVLERRVPEGRGIRPIAANVDQVFVVTAATHPAPIPQLIDRLLV